MNFFFLFSLNIDCRISVDAGVHSMARSHYGSMASVSIGWGIGIGIGKKKKRGREASSYASSLKLFSKVFTIGLSMI